MNINKRKSINIINRKARYEYTLDKSFIAGIQLIGSEIKSIREMNVNIVDSYCYFVNNELFVKNIYIDMYKYSHAFTDDKYDPVRERKLLLNREELNKIRKKIEIKGYTIVPIRLFINEKGKAKLEISTAKGKKMYDKKQTIKQRDLERDSKRIF